MLKNCHTWLIILSLSLKCWASSVLPHARLAPEEKPIISGNIIIIEGTAYNLTEIYAAIPDDEASSSNHVPSGFHIPHTYLAASIFNPQPPTIFQKAEVDDCLDDITKALQKHEGSLRILYPQKEVTFRVDITLTPLDVYTSVPTIIVQEAVAILLYLKIFLTKYSYYQTMYLLFWRYDKLIGSLDIARSIFQSSSG